MFRRKNKSSYRLAKYHQIKHYVYPVFVPQKLMHARKTLAQRTVPAKMYRKVFNAIVYQDSQERIAPVRSVLSNISSTRDSVSSGFPNTEKRVETVTTRIRVSLRNFAVLGNVVKQKSN